MPSHYSGVYTIRSSVGRFPKWGGATSVPGQEGVPAIVAPMTRTLEDLEFFWKAVVGMEPWKWDHTVSGFNNRLEHFYTMKAQCLPLPWQNVNLAHRKLRFGVMWDDGKSFVSARNSPHRAAFRRRPSLTGM